ncbi:MAG: hypothetical protein KA099_05500 [Alphaproteobacteria bacterium]|nr:hypothetical protein [Alphaproteobacteria bacterium]MBP7761119.1 hypothetical protein [Alphaproteobacteria bacterium]MBP7904766.1 hypothetical protein [Alphaproteobacteria bacterium]
MSGTSATNTPRTRPTQLMPEGEDAVKALQSLLHILGVNPGKVDGDFGTNSKTAYDEARAKYSFLPDLTTRPDQSALEQVFRAVDQNLQTNVSFQQDYLRGVAAERNVVELQGALVAGGSWANRHLGDRISDAESVDIDGDNGTLTQRAKRNAATLTGVATMQASLNLLIGTELKPNGLMTAETQTAMQSYAEKNGLQLTGDVQQNFTLVVQHIDEKQGDALRARVGEVLRTDSDLRAPDARTLDAQIVMNGFALDKGLDIRTAPDSRQTDTRITAENSHTRTVIAPQTGVSLSTPQPAPVAEAEAESGPPFGLNEMYRVTRRDVLEDVASIAERQRDSAESPQHILAYSEESRGFLLISKGEGQSPATVYQISDRNVGQIMSGINDSSIALDTSARKYIAEKVHGDNPETKAYGSEELRTAFAQRPTRFTGDTREMLLTTSVRMPDGSAVTYGLDNLHDGLDNMDSKRDWDHAPDPIAVRDYVLELKAAVREVREERPTTLPEWKGFALNDQNSVEINVGGQTTRVPAEIWKGVAENMTQTQRGFSVGRNESAILRTAEASNGSASEGGKPGGDLSNSFGQVGTTAEAASDIVTENAADVAVQSADGAESEPALEGGPTPQRVQTPVRAV